MPFIAGVAVGRYEKLSVFGGDYATPDGTAVRDYIHVVDLAKAHIVGLNRLIEKNNLSNFEVFNIGTGTGSSVLDVIKAFEKVANKQLKYKIVNRREGDIVEAYADTSFANTELKWKAEYNLEEALASAWKWQQTLK
jgi:UDP-glucose 4-epimerase